MLFKGQRILVFITFLVCRGSQCHDRMGVGFTTTVKPADVVTSIKQPPALKGHLLLVLS